MKCMHGIKIKSQDKYGIGKSIAVQNIQTIKDGIVYTHNK